MSSPFVIITVVLSILASTVSSKNPPSCSCGQDNSSVKTGFCSSTISFKGTVTGRVEIKIPHTTGSDAFIEFRVRIDAIYKGLKRNLVGKTVSIGSENSVCGYKTLEKGQTYAFQVKKMKMVSICDRIDLFSDVTRLEKKGLLKKFENVCIPYTNPFRRILSEENEMVERGNFYERPIHQDGVGSGASRCHCPRRKN